MIFSQRSVVWITERMRDEFRLLRRSLRVVAVLPAVLEGETAVDTSRIDGTGIIDGIVYRRPSKKS